MAFPFQTLLLSGGSLFQWFLLSNDSPFFKGSYYPTTLHLQGWLLSDGSPLFKSSCYPIGAPAILIATGSGPAACARAIRRPTGGRRARPGTTNPPGTCQILSLFPRSLSKSLSDPSLYPSLGPAHSGRGPKARIFINFGRPWEPSGLVWEAFCTNCGDQQPRSRPEFAKNSTRTRQELAKNLPSTRPSKETEIKVRRRYPPKGGIQLSMCLR